MITFENCIRDSQTGTISVHTGQAIRKFDIDMMAFEQEMLKLLDGLRICIEQQRLLGPSVVTTLTTSRASFRAVRPRVLRSMSEADREAQCWIDIGADLDNLLAQQSLFVFVSHGGFNQSFVRDLVSELKDKWQVSCVVAPHPADVPPNFVHRAINAAKAFVSVICPNSGLSGDLRDQQAFAEDRGKTLIPLYLSSVSIPAGFEYQLAHAMGISFLADKTVARQGGVAGNSLLEILQRALGQPTETELLRVECARLQALNEKLLLDNQRLQEERNMI